MQAEGRGGPRPIPNTCRAQGKSTDGEPRAQCQNMLEFWIWPIHRVKFVRTSYIDTYSFIIAWRPGLGLKLLNSLKVCAGSIGRTDPWPPDPEPLPALFSFRFWLHPILQGPCELVYSCGCAYTRGYTCDHMQVLATPFAHSCLPFGSSDLGNNSHMS